MEEIAVNENIAYLLGAMRDASIDLRDKKNYELRLYQSYAPWLFEIKEILEKEFGFPKVRISGNLLRANGKDYTKRLTEISEYENPQENWATPSIIKNADRDLIWHYVGGFWDAEGGLPFVSKQIYTSFDQKNKASLEFIHKFLMIDGIQPTNLTYTGKVWQFRITRRNSLKLFANKIKSRHKEKIYNINKLVAGFP